ncbi:MAG: methyltransferase domain-containing protein, partial [Desulfamplus sp.]|nr:methyltransferase domain-containing protein [Desulfamplus sp.]
GGGGERFPFQDKEFSVIHSNAVIEHVGNHERQLDFINEIARCGERFYFSTPAREFLIEIHTNLPIIHWLPKTAFDYLLIKSSKAWAAGNYMHLLTKTALRKLMQQAQINEYQIITHRLFGIPYQYVVVGKS